MAPSLNTTLAHINFLQNQPVKRVDYMRLLWTFRHYDFTKDSKYNEDQLKYWEHLPILPIVATLILTLTVFLLLVFQRNPSLVAGIVAAGLGTIALYLFLNSMNNNRISYE